MKKTIEEALSLIESMALNHHQWSTKGSAQSRSTSKYDTNVLQSLAAKVNSLTQKFNYFNMKYVMSTTISCEIYRSNGHISNECQLGISQPMENPIEHAHAIGNFNARPQNVLYSNTYNPGWRNHSISPIKLTLTMPLNDNKILGNPQDFNQDSIISNRNLTQRHFQKALLRLKPSRMKTLDNMKVWLVKQLSNLNLKCMSQKPTTRCQNPNCLISH